MSRVAAAVWEFVVGEDPWSAAGVVVALGLTALIGGWWVAPACVAVVLAASVWRAG